MADSRADRTGLNLARFRNFLASRERRSQRRAGSMIAIVCDWRSGSPWSRTYRRGWPDVVSRRGRSCPARTPTNVSGPGDIGGSPGRWTPAVGKVDKKAVPPQRNVADPRDQGRFGQGPAWGADAAVPPGSAWQGPSWWPSIRPAVTGSVTAELVGAGLATARAVLMSPTWHGGW
jgi:hypothetical protein